MAERSSIEVFFKAIGHQNVQRAMRSISNDSRRLGSNLSAVGGVGFAGISQSLRGASSITGSFVRNAGGLAPAFNLARGAVNGVKSASYGMLSVLLSSAGAVYGLRSAFGTLFEANEGLKGTVLALRSLNDEADKASGSPLFSADAKGSGLFDINGGGARASADDLSFLNQVADEHGTKVSQISASYVQLRAATKGSNIELGTLKRVFDGIADAGVSLGLDDESQKRALNALQQIASKGTLMSEELKSQLGDALPGTITDAADAFGVSVKTFLKMVENQEITADEFFLKFGNKLQEKYSKSAEDMADTTKTAAGQVGNAWNNAKILIASGDLDGVFKGILTTVKDLLNTLSANGAFARFGEKLADTLGRVGKRFQDAVYGGYDFERVLDGVARAFDGTVRFGEGLFDLFVRLKIAATIALGIIRGYGGEIPRVDDMMRSLGDGVVDFFSVISSGQQSKNSFINFLAAASVAAAEFIKLLVSSASRGDGVASFTNGLQSMSYWLGQLAHAFKTIRTGTLSEGIDSTGLGLVSNIQSAIDNFKKLKEGAAEFYGVLRDSDYAPQGGNAQANGMAYALRELFTGGEAEAFDGENLKYDGQLEFFFQIRDTLKSIGNFLSENREALSSFFSGALDAISLFLDLVRGVSGALESIGLNGNLAYVAGLIFGLSKIPFMTTAVVAAFGVISSAIGGMTLAALPWITAIGAIGLAVYGLYKYWDEVSTVVKVVGLRIKAVATGDTSLFDEANNEKSLLRLRQVLRRSEEYKFLRDKRDLGDDEAIDLINGGFKLSGDQMQVLNGSLSESIVSQRDLAAQMRIANDNAAFGGAAPANDRGLSQPVIFDLGNGQTVELAGPDYAANKDKYDALYGRMRPGRAPAYVGSR